MVNKPTELNTVPFYWTVLLGKTIRYAGERLGINSRPMYVCITTLIPKLFGPFCNNHCLVLLNYRHWLFPPTTIKSNVISLFWCRLWGGIHWAGDEREVWGHEVPGIVHQVSWENKHSVTPPLTDRICVFIFLDYSHLRNDEVIAVASLNYDPAASAVAERFASGKVITKKEAQYVKYLSFFISFFLLNKEAQFIASDYIALIFPRMIKLL